MSIEEEFAEVCQSFDGELDTNLGRTHCLIKKGKPILLTLWKPSNMQIEINHSKVEMYNVREIKRDGENIILDSNNAFIRLSPEIESITFNGSVKGKIRGW